MSWKNGVSVYRQTEADRIKNNPKELVAKFKLASDADFFADRASRAFSVIGKRVFWTVEDSSRVITEYAQTGEDLQ
jgi:2-keto-4-pentenoate hydratase